MRAHVKFSSAKHTTSEANLDEVQAVTCALKQAANMLGQAAGGASCPIVHIKGIDHIYSCYDISRSGNVLALYSKMHATSIELFDTAAVLCNYLSMFVRTCLTCAFRRRMAQ